MTNVTKMILENVKTDDLVRMHRDALMVANRYGVSDSMRRQFQASARRYQQAMQAVPPANLIVR